MHSETKNLSLLKAQRTSTEQQILQLENRQKALLSKQLDAERKSRNHRLIIHGVMLESVFPQLISINDETVRSFLTAISLLRSVQNELEKGINNADTQSLP